MEGLSQRVPDAREWSGASLAVSWPEIHFRALDWCLYTAIRRLGIYSPYHRILLSHVQSRHNNAIPDTHWRISTLT